MVLGEAVADVGAVVALVAEKPDALLALLLCLLPMTRLPVLLLLLLFLWLLLLLLLGAALTCTTTDSTLPLGIGMSRHSEAKK